MSTYKPTEHESLKQGGTPDRRVSTCEFAHGKVDPHEAGKQGGHTSGSGGGNFAGDNYKPTENNRMKKDREPDGRTK